ncbi:MFS transporter [Lysinibacillus sphaericus]|uniref:MFS transporter n=1 Tax=Lysinibacillus sphaericus TaxID=1421 RepID=UPI0018CC972B|nr:MFS transporter [Lysinibacillus sphaericus]MBG9453846.1 MFS transporter [Lysinibacillus sphaericus]MBG9476316.1 MFS transporter [Lysinibacillus sphaericus]MBG9591731.1 MFS transporter [Lysinibacillus sphaericus]
MKLRDIHPNIKLRLVMQFLGGLISMAVIPFLAIYFTQNIGATKTAIILIMIVISGVIGRFIGGHISDKIGRKKIMIYSEIGLLLSYLFIALCNSPWFNLPYISAAFFIINMFCGGMFQPAAQAMMIDVTNSDSRKLVFTISYWLGNLSTAIGGIVGAFLFKNYLFELFIGISLISLLSVLITVFFITETYLPEPSPKSSKHKKKSSSVEMLQTYSTVLKDKLFMFYILGAILIFTLEQSLSNYIGIRLEKDIPQHSASLFGIDFIVDGTKMLGFLRTENTILVVILSSAVLFLLKKCSDRWTLVTGMLIFSICFSVFASSNSVLILFIAMFFGTIGELMFVPIKQAMIGELAPSNARSTYMAFNSLTTYGAMIIASLLIIIGEWIHPIYMSGLLLILGLTGTFLYYIVTKTLYAKISEKNDRKVLVS